MAILHLNGQVHQAVKTSGNIERVNVILDLVGKLMQKMVPVSFSVPATGSCKGVELNREIRHQSVTLMEMG